MKKKIIIYSIFLSLISIMAFGTLAYFTAREDVTNIITTGSIGVEIVEVGEDGEEFPTDGVTGVTPGGEIVKDVRIRNSGRNPMWLRVKAVMEFVDNEELDINVVTLDYNLGDWTLKDGWYYYNTAIEPNELTTALFTTVMFDAIAMDNTYQNQTFTITVIGDAIQSQNNGTNPLLASGWED